MTQAVRVAILIGLAGCAAAGLVACGSAGRARAHARAAGAPALAPGPAFGLTEDSAALLSPPGSPVQTAIAEAARESAGRARVEIARAELSALHPTYLRLLIDWAALQPRADRPPALEARVSGCARSVEPCARYGGVREELAAIASQQRANGTGAYQVVLVIFGTPAWAARAPAGCERGGVGAFSRAPSAAGLLAYRALIHALVALSARERVALDWWAPWNEPNDPTFLSPQRSSCAPGAQTRSPSRYAELARAMAAQLRAEGGERHLLLGELNAYQGSSPDRTSVAEFVGALPADAACVGAVWSLHAYANRGAFAPLRDPVTTLEQSLDARGGCSRGAPIWVTEAGAGASHAGMARPAGAAQERAACLALAHQLSAWDRDPRVGAVFQYTFRDDPAFPVGLSDPGLGRTYSAYRLWLTWTHDRAPGRAAPTLAGSCA